jgi:hypothetical protein
MGAAVDAARVATSDRRMRTALDAPTRLMDAEEKRFVAAIRKHGWFDTGVRADDEGPGFAYTTGFWLNLRHPELILFGLPQQTMHDILWDAYRAIRDGEVWPANEPVSRVFGNHKAVLLSVDTARYADFLGWSLWFYGGDVFPCLQVVWPDSAGKFPWQDGAALDCEADQPDLSIGAWAGLMR